MLETVRDVVRRLKKKKSRIAPFNAIIIIIIIIIVQLWLDFLLSLIRFQTKSVWFFFSIRKVGIADTELFSNSLSNFKRHESLETGLL